MTKTLILMRHAKSSWGGDVLNDHDRPLNGRGQRSAAALGGWMRDKGWLPDQVLCSSSTRTRETFAGLNIDTAAGFTDMLYHAGSDQMRVVLEMARGQTVLMIGHNPGIAECAERLVAQKPKHRKFHQYPTGATTVIRFDIDDWDDVDWHRGEALDFIVPRELADT